MWTLLCALVLLSAACSGNPIVSRYYLKLYILAPIFSLQSKPQLRDAEDDIEFAKYSNKKVSYDLDVLEARTNILALELQYTVFDLVLDIEELLYGLVYKAFKVLL